MASLQLDVGWWGLFRIITSQSFRLEAFLHLLALNGQIEFFSPVDCGSFGSIGLAHPAVGTAIRTYFDILNSGFACHSLQSFFSVRSAADTPLGKRPTSKTRFLGGGDYLGCYRPAAPQAAVQRYAFRRLTPPTLTGLRQATTRRKVEQRPGGRHRCCATATPVSLTAVGSSGQGHGAGFRRVYSSLLCRVRARAFRV